MGTETYPKKGASNVGEQESKTFLSRDASPGYQQHGSRTDYAGKSSHPSKRLDAKTTSQKPFVTGGSGQMVSATYPRKLHESFESEKGNGSLPAIPGAMPKEA